MLVMLVSVRKSTMTVGREYSNNASNASIRQVDKPQEEPIVVALSRLCRCPSEILDEFWPACKQA